MSLVRHPGFDQGPLVPHTLASFTHFVHRLRTGENAGLPDSLDYRGGLGRRRQARLL